MFKSMKKVLVGVLAASLMLTSVAFAADSPSKVNEPKKQTATKSTVSTIKKDTNVVISFKKAKTTIKASALTSKTKTLKLNASSKKKVVVKKSAFKNANKNLKLTVNKNYVTFEKKAFSTKKGATKKMTIYVEGYTNSKASKAAFKKYCTALKKAGFEGKIYRMYKGKKYTK